jgi:RNA polymerase sigma-70 factor (ECF subfamily)
MQGNVSAGSNIDLVPLIPALRRFAKRFCRNNDDADDLVQETLAKALAHLDSFQPGTSLKSWMFTILRNTHHTGYHKQKRTVLGVVDFDQLMPTVGPSQEWVLRKKEFDRVFNTLPRHSQDAATMVLIEGNSYEDASGKFGCAIGTVKSRVNRARKQLADGLGDTVKTAASV